MLYRLAPSWSAGVRPWRRATSTTTTSALVHSPHALVARRMVGYFPGCAVFGVEVLGEHGSHCRLAIGRAVFQRRRDEYPRWMVHGTLLSGLGDAALSHEYLSSEIDARARLLPTAGSSLTSTISRAVDRHHPRITSEHRGATVASSCRISSSSRPLPYVVYLVTLNTLSCGTRGMTISMKCVELRCSQRNCGESYCECTVTTPRAPDFSSEKY